VVWKGINKNTFFWICKIKVIRFDSGKVLISSYIKRTNTKYVKNCGFSEIIEEVTIE
jgi:hypothetical protein